MKNKTLHFAKVAVTSVAFFGFVAFATATTWTAPTGTAPANNVSAPINVSSTAQTKAGELDVTNFYNWGTEFISGLTAIGAVWPGTASTTPPLYVGATSGTSAVFGGGIGVRGSLGVTNPGGTLVSTTTPGFDTIYVQSIPVCLQNGVDCPTATGGSVAPWHMSGTDAAPIARLGTSAVTLNSNQGGAIELGAVDGGANAVSTGTPYIDFHAGAGGAQDYNVRVINSANNELDIQTASAGTALSVNGSAVSVPGTLKVGGQSVCEQNGTNCPGGGIVVPTPPTGHASVLVSAGDGSLIWVSVVTVYNAGHDSGGDCGGSGLGEGGEVSDLLNPLTVNHYTCGNSNTSGGSIIGLY